MIFYFYIVIIKKEMRRNPNNSNYYVNKTNKINNTGYFNLQKTLSINNSTYLIPNFRNSPHFFSNVLNHYNNVINSNSFQSNPRQNIINYSLNRSNNALNNKEGHINKTNETGFINTLNTINPNVQNFINFPPPQKKQSTVLIRSIPLIPNFPQASINQKNEISLSIDNQQNEKENGHEIMDNSFLIKVSTHIFNDSIERIVNLINDAEFFISSCFPTCEQLSCSKSNYLNTEGNIISFRMKQLYRLEFMCTKSIKNQSNLTFTLILINMSPLKMGSLEMKFKFYYNTCQGKTVFIIEKKLEKGFLPEILEETKFEKKIWELYKKVEDVLSLKINDLQQESSIEINVSKNKAWDYIIDSEKAEKYQFFFQNNLKFIFLGPDGKKIKKARKGDFILIVQNNDTIIGKILIKNILESYEFNEILLIINDNNILNQKYCIIKQIISIKIRNISNEKCLLIIKHIAEDYVEEKTLNLLSITKSKVLKNYKIILERIFEDFNDNN